jgi:hypothetical protein
MAVGVQQGAVIGFGPPTALFPLPPSSASLAPESEGFDLSADGQRFLVLTRSLDSSGLQVLVNWQVGLKG